MRNQGSKGVIRAAQTDLAVINLARFRTVDEPGFLHALDDATEELTRTLAAGAQNWGAGRKADLLDKFSKPQNINGKEFQVKVILT